MKPLLYIRFTDNEIKQTRETKKWNVDIDEDGDFVGIEILSYESLELDGQSLEKFIEEKIEDDAWKDL